MDKDDAAARKARAERLRQQISNLVNKPDTAKGGDEKDSSQESPPAKESPRDFIHRRMEELDKKKE